MDDKRAKVDQAPDPREARQGIIECGKASAKSLQSLFEDRNLEQLKEDVIEAFGEIRCDVCVEQLIELLYDNDDFWSRQHLESAGGMRTLSPNSRRLAAVSTVKSINR